ncbi:MAG: purine-binding chemotaxis protein CheW [Candidatus Riflebacteria bacterium]|nr:purine-binding chemotaxis protein CheW [Candidatus Riflebacteria bacterium]
MNEFPLPKLKRVLVFTLDNSRHALPLSVIDCVVRVVEITPLPKMPEFIRGVINLHGTVIPVIDLRKRLGLPWREMILDDRFIIARTAKRTVAIMADSVAGIYELPDKDLVSADKNFPFAEDIKGLAKLDDELILVYDLDQFLALDEETALTGELTEKTSWDREKIMEKPHVDEPEGTFHQS